MMNDLAAERGEEKIVMIDATYLKPTERRTVWASKRGCGDLIDRTKRGLNTKLHAICDNQVRPLNLSVAAGQVSDHDGARALLSSLPDVDYRSGAEVVTLIGFEKR